MKFTTLFTSPLALAAAIAFVPFAAAPASAQPAPAATPAATSNAVDYKELEKFMSVYERVKSSYVDPVNDHTLIKGAIDGMLSALDPHSSYMEDADFDSLRATTQGNYGGLGISVTIEDGVVKVITPTEGSPAARAGIKAGDYITEVDGKLLYGATLDQAVDQMKGKAGTSVKLTIVRPGHDKPFDVTLVREQIELKPVKWEIKDGSIGYIDLNQFSGNSAQAVEAALADINKATGGHPLGYILDLRSNPGGLLDQAVEISDDFLDRGEIVSQRGRDPTDIERYYAKPGDMAHGLPVIVLTDAGTASAAEIVAGALQDQHRALIMGERSFGKGSVQTVMQTGARSALRLTTARYYTPSGRSVQAGGITPDIIVPQLSDPDYKNHPVVREEDLRRHLLAQAGADDKLLEGDDTATDPRFALTADELKKKGIKDFQLYYALNTLKRLASPATATASSSAHKS